MSLKNETLKTNKQKGINSATVKKRNTQIRNTTIKKKHTHISATLGNSDN